MFKVEAIVREEALEDVKQALFDIEIRGITVSQVMGCGTQMGYTHYVRGSVSTMTMLPKVKFEVVVSTEAWADKCIAAICTAARSGRVGDGKIFCYEVGRAVRIRTGEEGVDAIQPGPPETDEDE